MYYKRKNAFNYVFKHYEIFKLFLERLCSMNHLCNNDWSSAPQLQANNERVERVGVRLFRELGDSIDQGLYLMET